MPDPPLEILILGINYQPEVTGIAPYTTGLARDLSSRGHRVRVLTSFPHYPAWSFDEGYERGLRRREWDGDVEVIRLRHPLPRNSVGPARVLMEAVFAVQATIGGGRSPDVVIAVSPALLSVAAALARRLGRRTAVGAVVQDLYSRAFPETGALGGRGESWVRRLERSLLSRVDGVAAIHEKFRGTISELGVPADRISVIRNWSHISASTASRAETRASFGWSESETVVLHAGNMGHKQGLENVVEAARLADDESAPVRFVLLGDGVRRPVLVRQGAGVRSLQFVAPVPDGRFEDVLAAADMLLLNEKPEVSDMCVPGKLTSYFAAGRPVLAVTDPRSGAAAELLAARAGVLVASGEPSLLLKAALTMRESPEDGAALGRSGRRYADEVLTEQAGLDAYAEWVHELVRRRRHPDSGPGPRGLAPGRRARTAVTAPRTPRRSPV